MGERDARPVVMTVGHSTVPIEAFLAMLREAGVERLVDVRRFPASRRHPQFGRERLEASLAAAGIRYEHEEALGGHRKPRPHSPNVGLREDAFRGYADHMRTPMFLRAAARLVEGAGARRTAVMCAEGAPERCHRSLLADHLAARGVRVVHLLPRGASRPHAMDPRASLSAGGALTYPERREGQLDLFGDP